MAEVCDIKFSNDGKSMLLTTTGNNIYVLDAYGGEKVSSVGSVVVVLFSSRFHEARNFAGSENIYMNLWLKLFFCSALRIQC